ncbi:MAG: hypothetical protein JXR46_05505 [Calditrichaceae bacterium]|nr:hypothetical protein [Calditrichaceae bacterium]MBN2708482.1 hypothetical protein [Calditrichaceae bacterium]RQV91953.1 MAG: hypothetical protein EH224_16855 [Calditrichota bacterium]
MKIDPEKIIRELEELANLSVKSVFYKWKSINIRQVNEFAEIISELKNENLKSLNNENSCYELGAQFSDMLNKIKNWIEHLHIIPEPNETTELIIDWNQQFKSYIAPYPESIRIPFPGDFWISKTIDSIGARIYKWIYRNFLNYFNLKFINKDKNRYLRKIELYEFLRYSIELPVDKFIEQEKNIYLKGVSTQIKKIHSQLLMTKSVFLSSEDSILKSIKNKDYYEKCIKAIDILNSQINSFNGWKEYENNLNDRFTEFWQEIAKDFKSAWNLAGTFKMRSKKYSDLKNRKLRKDFNLRRNTAKQDWYDYFDVVIQGLKKDIEISLVQLHITSICRKTITNIKSDISERIRPNFLTIIKHINTSSEKIRKVDASNHYKKLFIDEKESFRKIIREQELPRIIDVLVNSTIKNQLSGYTQEIIIIKELISEKHRLIISENNLNNNGAPKVKSCIVDTRKIFEKALSVELVKYNQQLQKYINSELEKIMRSVSDIDHVLYFHFEEAARLLNQNNNGKMNNEACVTAMDGFELAENQLKKLEQESVKLETYSERELIDHTTNFLRNLQETTESDVLFNLKLHKNDYKKLLLFYPQNGNNKSDTDTDHSVKNLSLSIITGKALRLKKQFSSDSTKIVNEITIKNTKDYLANMNERIKAVPFVYQRLFNLNPLHEDRFFTGRIEELNYVTQKYEEWKNKVKTAVIVLSRQGDGLSSFMNIISNKLPQKEKIIRINFKEHQNSISKFCSIISNAFGIGNTDDYTKMLKQLEDLKSPVFCVVEGLERLFLRKVNGMSSVRSFINLVLRTSNNIFWLIGCNHQTWLYFDRAHNLNKCIPAKILLTPFTDKELVTILYNRHRLSGYNLIFKEGKELQNKTFIKNMDALAKQKFLQQLFFNQLLSIAGGNPSTAILYWLNSIESVSDGNVILIADEINPGIVLSKIDQQTKLMIESIYQHGGLDNKSLSEIMLLPEHECQRCLSSSWVDGILLQDDIRYFVHPFIQNTFYNFTFR